MSVGKNLSYFLIILTAVLLLGLGYFIFQNQKLIKQLTVTQSSPTLTISASPPTSSPSQLPSPSPTLTLIQLQENIADGVNSRNFAALATFMTNPVLVILQATECCGPQTPDEAVSQFSYINDGIPFDFNQNQETIKNLKSKNTELANKYVGISKNAEHLVAFGITGSNRIGDVRFSVSWKLFAF